MVVVFLQNFRVCYNISHCSNQFTFLPLQAPDVTLMLSTPIIMSISIGLISILKHLQQMTSVYIVAQTEIAHNEHYYITYK